MDATQTTNPETTMTTTAIAAHDGTDLSHLPFDGSHNVTVNGVALVVARDGSATSADAAGLARLATESPYVTATGILGAPSFHYGYGAIDLADEQNVTRGGTFSDPRPYQRKLAELKAQAIANHAIGG
jgi:hypothetical protein